MTTSPPIAYSVSGVSITKARCDELDSDDIRILEGRTMKRTPLTGQACFDINSWLDMAMMALPVILLRG